MPYINVTSRFIQKLSPVHTDKHTEPTDYAIWTTKVVGNKEFIRGLRALKVWSFYPVYQYLPMST